MGFYRLIDIFDSQTVISGDLNIDARLHKGVDVSSRIAKYSNLGNKNIAVKPNIYILWITLSADLQIQ